MKKYTVNEVMDKLEKHGVKFEFNETFNEYHTQVTKPLGIHLLGMVDFLVNYHRFRVLYKY